MNSTVYNVDGSPSSPLLSCKASKTWALKGEAGKKQPGLNRKGGRGGGEKKEKNSTLKRCFEGWEVAPTLPEDQDLILNTHIAAHSYPRGYKTLFWSPREPGMHMVHRYTCRQKSHIHNNLIKKKKRFWARYSGTKLIQTDPKFKANLFFFSFRNRIYTGLAGLELTI